MQRILVLLLIAASFVLACGCAQSSPPPAESPQSPAGIPAAPPPVRTTTALPVQATTPTPTPVMPGNTVIRITPEGLQPADVTIRTGSQVEWVNSDTSENGHNPAHRIEIAGITSSQLFSPGQNWDWTFTRAGVYTYSDLVHPTLHGTVTVVG